MCEVQEQMRVTLIQCTNSKRDEMSMAKNLYDESAYFRKMRAWAEERGNPWYILSAKHGLVAPNEIIEPYDERGISKSDAIEIALKIDALGFDTVDITAGMDYTNHLVPELERDGIEVINYFAGEPIGRRKQLLQSAIDHMQHNTL